MKKSSLGKLTFLALGSILALSMFAGCGEDDVNTTDEARRSNMYTNDYYNDYNGYDDSLTNTTDQNGYVNGSPLNERNGLENLGDDVERGLTDFGNDIERGFDDVVDGVRGNMGENYGTTNSDMLRGANSTGMKGYDPYGTHYGTTGANYTTNGTDYGVDTRK